MPEPTALSEPVMTKPDAQNFFEALKNLKAETIDRVPTPVKFGVVTVAVIAYQLFGGGVSEAEGVGPTPTKGPTETGPRVAVTATKPKTEIQPNAPKSLSQRQRLPGQESQR
jgi:hypothetical protein